MQLRLDSPEPYAAADRFGILLPDTDAAQAELIGRQLAESVHHVGYRSRAGEALYQRVSIGVAAAVDERADDLLRRANEALRQAKADADDKLQLAA